MTPMPPAPRPVAFHSGTPNEDDPNRGLFATRSPKKPPSHLIAAVISASMLIVAVIVALPRMSSGPSPAAGPDGCSSYTPVAPTGSGVVRNVASPTDLASALSAAMPGDTINLASGRYEQLHYRQAYGHRSGAEGRPIVIQAAAGAAPVIGFNGIDPGNWKPAVDVVRLEHVVVRGLEIGNAMFGARSSGSHHVTFEYNTISNLGHSGIITQAYWNDQAQVSSNTTIRCNKISRTGKVESEFGEGIYIGTGTFSKTDRSHDMTVEHNELFDLSNEAIDVKHYTTNVSIRHNRIHDLTPNYGGAISLGLNRSSWGPANYLVEENQIWNVSNGMHYAQAIAVAHGPTEIRNNTIWNVEVDPQSTWPGKHVIQVHGDDNPADWASAFGSPSNNQVTIVDNTIHGCTESCISSYADPLAISPDVAVAGNVVTAESRGMLQVRTETIAAPDDFVGPTVGPADSGSGPGSGLTLKTDVQTTTTSTTSTTPTTVEQRADETTSTTVTATTGGSDTPPTSSPDDSTASTTSVASDDGLEDSDSAVSTIAQRPTTEPISAPSSTSSSVSGPSTSSDVPGSGPSTTSPGEPGDSQPPQDESGPSTTVADDAPQTPVIDDEETSDKSTSTPEDVDGTSDDVLGGDGKPGRRRGQQRAAERRRGTPPRTTTTQPGSQPSLSHDGWWSAVPSRRP